MIDPRLIEKIIFAFGVGFLIGAVLGALTYWIWGA